MKKENIEKLDAWINKEFKNNNTVGEDEEYQENKDRANKLKEAGPENFEDLIVNTLIQHYDERDGVEMLQTIMDED